MKPSNRILGSTDVDIGVGGICHSRFVVGVSSLLLDSPAKCAPFCVCLWQHRRRFKIEKSEVKLVNLKNVHRKMPGIKGYVVLPTK
jgi:hypothetical protein